MAALEGRRGEKEKVVWERTRVEELRELREKDWADPYAANRKLRRPFREQRKERRREEGVREELQERFGLGFEIVDEREEDRQRAKLIGFGGAEAEMEGDGEAAAALKAASRPLFGEDVASDASSSTPNNTKRQTKAERAAERSKQALRQKLKGNTRAAMDPFSTAEKPRTGPPTIVGLKRKRAALASSGDATTAKDGVSRDTTPEGPPLPASKPPPEKKKALVLVDYDSDDE